MKPTSFLSSLASLRLGGSMLFLATIAAPVFAEDSAAKKINYQDDILPILRNACLNCHNPDKKKSGLDLSNYQGMMTGSDDGIVIKPGDASASKLFKNITQSEEPFMPQKADKLPDKDLAVFKKWIDGGAPETSGSKVTVAKKTVDLTVTVSKAGRPAGPPPMPQGSWPLDSLVRTQRPGALLALAASPWAPLVAVGSQHQILLYNSDTLDLLGMLPFPEGQPNVIRFSRNGKLLICGGGQAAKSGKVIAWDVATGKRVTEVGDEFDAVLAADMSADQKTVLLGGPSKVLKAFSTADGKQLWQVKKHTDWVTAAAVAPDGVLCASGDRAGNLYVWEAKTGRDFYTLSGHKDAITDLVFRDDANILASASADGTVKLWNMHDGTPASSINAHGSGVTSIGYSHEGKIVSTGRDNVTKVWKTDGGQERALDAFADVALRATFTHDGGRIVAGDWSGVIRVWNAADGTKVGELSSNPITPAEKLAAMAKQLDELTATSKAASGELDKAKAAADKAATELTAARAAKGAQQVEQAMNNLNNARGAAQQAATALQKAKDNANNAKAEAQRLEVAKTQAAIARDNIQKGQGNTRQAAQQRYLDAVKYADAAAAAVQPAADQIPKQQKNAEAQAENLKKAEAALATARAAADPLAQALPEKSQAATAANDALAKARLTADVAGGKQKVAQAEVDRLKAVLAARSGPPEAKRESVAPTTNPVAKGKT